MILSTGCLCIKCVYDRQHPIYAQLVDEFVRANGWGPSFAIPYLLDQ